jgi:hypothetical protein
MRLHRKLRARSYETSVDEEMKVAAQTEGFVWRGTTPDVELLGIETWYIHVHD